MGETPDDVSELDSEILKVVNKVRSDPLFLVPDLEAMLPRFEGNLYKEEGKITLST